MEYYESLKAIVRRCNYNHLNDVFLLPGYTSIEVGKLKISKK